MLGVRRTATQEEIKAAFRALARKEHPDVSIAPDAHSRFQEITEAYETLFDPGKRETYNTALTYTETIQRQREEAEAARTRSEFYRNNPPPSEPTKKPHEKEKASEQVSGGELLKLSAMISQGQFKSAEILADSILRKDNRQPLAYAAKADIARHRGDLRAAAKFYALAAQYDPQSVIYQNRQVEMLEAIESGRTARNQKDESKINPVPLGVGLFLIIVMWAYTIILKEPTLTSIPLLSKWTVGLIVMLALSGVTMGAVFSASDVIERFQASQKSALTKRSPAMTLGMISVLCFWLATALYVMVGAMQQSFSASLSRVIGGVAVLTIFFSLGMWKNGNDAALQTLVFAGNVIYAGTILGWTAADSLRKPA